MWRPTGVEHASGEASRWPRLWVGVAGAAVTALLTLTVTVVLDAVDAHSQATSTRLDVDSPDPTPAPAARRLDGPDSVAAPVLNLATAELPPGGPYPHAGQGTWHVVPITVPVPDTGGPALTYVVEVEDGIDPAIFGGEDAFTAAVDHILQDPRGRSTARNVAFRRIDSAIPTSGSV